jgi:hypothetical protein
MKTLMLAILTTVGGHIAGAQAPTAAKPVLVSSTGIGELKLDMSLKKLNALLDLPVTARRANAKDQGIDTVDMVYKGYKLVGELYWRYIDENRGETTLYSLRCANTNLATKSGIRQGSDKFEVVKMLDGYNLSLYPDWHYELPAEKKRFSVLTLQDGDAGTMLLMLFDNNKLYAFEVRILEGC